MVALDQHLALNKNRLEVILILSNRMRFVGLDHAEAFSIMEEVDRVLEFRDTPFMTFRNGLELEDFIQFYMPLFEELIKRDFDFVRWTNSDATGSNLKEIMAEINDSRLRMHIAGMRPLSEFKSYEWFGERLLTSKETSKKVVIRKKTK